MSDIKALSASMINKIAAGEVIERPASVVKELMENAVDAGATRIELVIERSGSDLIQIIDNGNGIARDQLVLALSPHATSKIAGADDLFKISTLGFRGEALASIAEISQLVLRSCAAGAAEGAEIRSDGGKFSEVVPCGTSQGTVVEVRNIFFNVPARRKYLKSPATEFGHISEAFNRIAIPNPDIHFIFKHNGRVVQDLPAVKESRERIGRLFGQDIAERLIYVESRRGDVAIQGYVAHPDCSRSNNFIQYVFLNHRYIRDRAIQHALTEAYRGLIPTGRFPIAFVNIGVSPDSVDVNVHPTKLEVRFVNGSAIYSGFLGAIREEFLRSDMKSRPGLESRQNTGENASAPNVSIKEICAGSGVASTDPQSAMDDVSHEMRNRILGWATGDLEQAGTAHRDAQSSRERELSETESEIKFAEPLRQARFGWEGDAGEDSGAGLKLNRISGGSAVNQGAKARPDNSVAHGAASYGLVGTLDEIMAAQRRALEFEREMERDNARQSERNENTDQPADTVDSGSADSSPVGSNPVDSDTTPKDASPRVLQIHQRYLVTETEEGLVIIDQHAMHERILYERMKETIAVGKLDSQQLLVPVPVDLTPTELACALENREILADFGLMVDSFGGNTVLVTGYPAIIRNTPAEEILMILLKPLLESGRKPNREDLLDDMMHQMSCKAAVKAGDFLTPGDIDALLTLAAEEVNSHHCPHGRPSTLVFTCQELDKMFRRT